MARNLVELYVCPKVLTPKEVGTMTREQRLTIPTEQARRLGLKVVDGVGGTPQYVGTQKQYEEELLAVVHFDVPGTRAHA